MINVRVLKFHEHPYPLIRQTPGSSGIWNDVRFHFDDSAAPYDYVILLNGLRQRTKVHCRPDNIWAVIQEAPHDRIAYYHQGNSKCSRIYTTDPSSQSDRHHHFHGALDWHVGRSYDQLVHLPVPSKDKPVSCVMSNLDYLPGHKARLAFALSLQKELPFDWFGRGFAFIEDKWDALVSYKYSIAMENYSNEFYWTEKISDCFLSWTIPIYFGCRRIDQYFPKEAIVWVDIHDEDAPRIIADALKQEAWSKNLEAIRHARELVLNKYNLFAFLADEIARDDNRGGPTRTIAIPALKPPHRVTGWIKRQFARQWAP